MVSISAPDKLEAQIQTSNTSSSRETGNTRLSRTLSTSPSVGGQGSIISNRTADFDGTSLETRRKQTLLISILDLLVGLGLLIYHTARAINFFKTPEAHTPDDYEYNSPLVLLLWAVTFLIIILHVGIAATLLTCSYSIHCTDFTECSKTIKRVNIWILSSQLLMTIWILKLTIFTSSFQFDYRLGVFDIIVEDYSSIWFVLIFYVILILFRGVGIFVVRKYIREL